MRVLAALALTAVACTADPDHDGLSGKEEREAGSDPKVADTDGDGLSDGEEVAIGANPTSTDSDGDGYPDAAEVDAGSDPADDASWIYEGGWPYNDDKDALPDPGWEGASTAGSRLPRFAWADQYGDVVDIYDFAGQGKPMVLDLSGLWCTWCQEMASFLEGEETYYDNYPEYAGIPALVENGDVYWVTVLDAGYDPSVPADDYDVTLWAITHPNERIPVLNDAGQQMNAWMGVRGYPSLLLLDEQLVVDTWDDESYFSVFDRLNQLFPAAE